MYFYKDTDNWVLGYSTHSYAPAGQFALASTNDTYVSIVPIGSSDFVKFLGILITDIAKNSYGDKYASLSEFTTAVKPFFV